MLSYQHAYHAGNAADVHKHAALAVALAYMVQKPKPMVYMETHAGRALYDLGAAEARKTGEAKAGVLALQSRFASDHPYMRVLAACRAAHGPMAYPGSPWIARFFLRDMDHMVLCERHPAEAQALRETLPGVVVLEEDGPAAILSRCPPTPRRGCLLIDPSYEIKTEWETVPRLAAQIHRKWPVGTVAVWAPRLVDGRHRGLETHLSGMGAFVSHQSFPPARPGHGMTGSTLAWLNPPYGLTEAKASR